MRVRNKTALFCVPRRGREKKVATSHSVPQPVKVRTYVLGRLTFLLMTSCSVQIRGEDSELPKLGARKIILTSDKASMTYLRTVANPGLTARLKPGQHISPAPKAEVQVKSGHVHKLVERFSSPPELRSTGPVLGPEPQRLQLSSSRGQKLVRWCPRGRTRGPRGRSRCPRGRTERQQQGEDYLE